jgi:orotate phosphoribosyltransferase
MDALLELEKVGAILTKTHVVYTSGKHGSAYVNKDAVYPHTKLTLALTKQMAMLGESQDVQVVLAPAIGAVILGQLIANHLEDILGHPVLSVYAEKAPAGDGFVIKRGYDKLIRGRKVLVVEDIVNTGGSLLKVIQTAKEMGAEVIGAVALCNRGKITTKELDHIPWIRSLISIDLEAWDSSDCPLCQKGIPINKSVGKG